jgi:hypothetical protein
MQSLVAIKKSDSDAYTQLGGYEKQQGDTAASQYQQVLVATQQQAPSLVFQPSGAQGSQLGSGPLNDYYSQQNQGLSSSLYQQAITAYSSSLSDFQKAAKYATRANRPAAQLGVYSAAQLIGNKKVALHALQRYVELAPDSPTIKQIESQCKQLGGSCTPKQK